MKSTPMVIDVIHNTRQGIDLMAMPWERKTHYAKVDPNANVMAVPVSAESEGGIVDATNRSCHIAG